MSRIGGPFRLDLTYADIITKSGAEQQKCLTWRGRLSRLHNQFQSESDGTSPVMKLKHSQQLSGRTGIQLEPSIMQGWRERSDIIGRKGRNRRATHAGRERSTEITNINASPLVFEQFGTF